MQHAINAVAHDGVVFLGLEVDVGGLVVHSAGKHRVDQLDDRRLLDLGERRLVHQAVVDYVALLDLFLAELLHVLFSFRRNAEHLVVGELQSMGAGDPRNDIKACGQPDIINCQQV